MIRKARKEEVYVIEKIYINARKYMKDHGNPNQWINGYPSIKDIEKDIDEQKLYVIYENNMLLGVFAIMEKEEPSYKRIVNGKWRNDSQYITLHRVASTGKSKGIFNIIIDYVKKQTNHIRIDTHKDNKKMQDCIIKNGFEYCGIIYTERGDERLAYEWIK